MPQRTPKGAQEQKKWEAFRNYLKDLTRFQDMETAKEKYEKYLPYAIAFGVEKQWTRRFEDLTVSSPDWYHPPVIVTGRGSGPISTGGLGGGLGRGPISSVGRRRRRRRLQSRHHLRRPVQQPRQHVERADLGSSRAAARQQGRLGRRRLRRRRRRLRRRLLRRRRRRRIPRRLGSM